MYNSSQTNTLLSLSEGPELSHHKYRARNLLPSTLRSIYDRRAFNDNHDICNELSEFLMASIYLIHRNI